MKAGSFEPNPALIVDPMVLHLIEVWRHTPVDGGESTDDADNDHEAEAALAAEPQKVESRPTVRRQESRRIAPRGRHRDESIAPVLLTVGEVADVLCTTPKAVYEMARRGQLPGITRIGRRLLVRRDALVRFLDHKSAPSDRSIR